MTQELRTSLSAIKAIYPVMPEWLSNSYIEDFTEVEPMPRGDLSEHLSILQGFRQAAVPLAYLFNNKEYFKKLMQLLCEERASAALEMLVDMGGVRNVVLYLRASYRLGIPVINDQSYDALEILLKEAYPQFSDIWDTVEEEDTMTTLVESALQMSKPKRAKSSGATAKPLKFTGDAAELNSVKSSSIMPVRSYQEAYDYLKNSPECDTHWSLKIDGVNTKSSFKEDNTGLSVALSRGRASDSWDYTEAFRHMLKVSGIEECSVTGVIVGESVAKSEAVEVFAKKYPDRNYRSPKSIAGAMLRAPQKFDEEDYNLLQFYAFSYGDIMKDAAFAKLELNGFLVPPYVNVKKGEVPLGSLEEFTKWLDDNIFSVLWNEGIARGIDKSCTDGVVLQLLTNIEGDRADKYSDLNIALKFSHWTEGSYEAIVSGFEFEQKRVEVSAVLLIEPVTTRDMNVATRVSAGSLAILINDGVKVGDKIKFTRKSEANNVYEGKVV